ncbi:MAG: ATPase [Candidatus Andeanibacterium colombiense]|uniref:ATPase n=1 Tax=Candidatus Andeanibacterium colombiense TaxID=3121345 RepID=A0AAJ6BP22_9SPHN|nr:MAG: ATPase [Sphingomonadaceae bacterium]
MSQIALPLRGGPGAGPARIVLGNANAQVFEALAAAESWPFRTAVLAGPPRSGKSLAARWFTEQHRGEAIDDADRIEEAELFHRWNRAQESGTPLLLIARARGWEIALPDLKSRLGAALHLEFGEPDDEMAGALIEAHAEQRGLVLGEGATTYLVPRAERSFAGIEALVAAIDRLGLERKQPATLSIWREALEETNGAEQPRLF